MNDLDINFSIDNKSNNSIKDIDITDQDNNVFTSDRDSISFPVEHRHPTVFECSIDLCYISCSYFNQSQYSWLLTELSCDWCDSVGYYLNFPFNRNVHIQENRLKWRKTGTLWYVPNWFTYWFLEKRNRFHWRIQIL